MVATLGQKVVSFLAFYVIARLVGPTVTGKYFYAISITSVFVVFADFGLTPVVIRELAANEERGRAFLARALQLKAFLLPLAVIGALLYATFVKVEPDVLAAVVVACFVLMADSISLIFYGALRGKRDLRFEALGMLICQVVTAIASILILRAGGGVTGLATALLLGSLWNVGWSLVHAARRHVTPLKARLVSVKALMFAALPFGLAGLFVKVYSYADSLLIRQYFGHTAVGQYAVAYKLTYALQFLPLTFVAALYPAMSADFATGNHEGLRTSLKNGLRLMMLVSVPLSALLSVLARPIILNFYGRPYEGAIAPLMVLPWVLIPIFLDFPVGSLLNATRRSSLKTISMGITMVLNVLLNLLLVPTYGPLGAAYAGVVSFWLLFALGIWFARKELPERTWFISFFLRGVLCAALIWGLMHFIAVSFPFIAQLIFGSALSLLLLFVFRLCLVEDLLKLWGFLRRRAVPPPDATEEAGS
jgi:O-antigen/teichoic acid export membrane protein